MWMRPTHDAGSVGSGYGRNGSPIRWQSNRSLTAFEAVLRHYFYNLHLTADTFTASKEALEHAVTIPAMPWPGRCWEKCNVTYIFNFTWTRPRRRLKQLPNASKRNARYYVHAMLMDDTLIERLFEGLYRSDLSEIKRPYIPLDQFYEGDALVQNQRSAILCLKKCFTPSISTTPLKSSYFLIGHCLSCWISW